VFNFLAGHTMIVGGLTILEFQYSFTITKFSPDMTTASFSPGS
jgi:hypothetical protein